MTPVLYSRYTFAHPIYKSTNVVDPRVCGRRDNQDSGAPEAAPTNPTDRVRADIDAAVDHIDAIKHKFILRFCAYYCSRKDILHLSRVHGRNS